MRNGKCCIADLLDDEHEDVDSMAMLNKKKLPDVDVDATEI